MPVSNLLSLNKSRIIAFIFILILTTYLPLTICYGLPEFYPGYEERLVLYKGYYNVKRLPYIGKPLSALKGAKLFMSLLGGSLFAGTDYNSYWHPLADRITGLRDFVLEFNGVPSNDTVLQYGCGQYVGKRVYDNSSNPLLHTQDVFYEKCNVTLVDIGYVYFSYMDGKVHDLYLLPNDTIDWIGEYLANYTDFMYGFYDFAKVINATSINVSFVYAGIGADRVRISYEQEYMVVNGSLVSVNKTYIKLINPYYKFYILFGNIRYAYPIKFGIENVNGTPKLKFLEMFIPPLSIMPFDVFYDNGSTTIHEVKVSDPDDVYEVLNKFIEHDVFTVNDVYLEMIVDKFREAVNNTNVSLNDIVVADIYYLPTNDYNILTPVIELYVNNTEGLHSIVYMRLYKYMPVVEQVSIVAGQPSASDPQILLKLYVKKARAQAQMYEELYKKLVNYGIIMAPILLALAIILILHSRRHRKR